MDICVISDTHAGRLGDLPGDLVEAVKAADLVVHAGDFTANAVLDELETLRPVHAVAGNMDSAALKARLPERTTFVAEGKRIGLIHGWGSPAGIADRVRAQFQDVDIIIFGHSHALHVSENRGVVMFNPGPARDSFGLLRVSEDGSIGVEIRQTFSR